MRITSSTLCVIAELLKCHNILEDNRNRGFCDQCDFSVFKGRFAKMAPGGSARKQSDDEDGIHEERPSLYRASSVDEVSGQAPAIVATFLGECFRADGLPVPVELSENQKKVNKDVAHVIRDIGDRLTNDTSLNSLISQVHVSKDTAFDTFLQVAAQIFSDGVVNWGRIVTLFYFGYKLAVQVINEIPLIKMIIQWVVQFIKDRLAKWIFEQGGWESVVEYFTTLRQKHDLQVYFVFGCICALGAMLLWRRQ